MVEINKNKNITIQYKNSIFRISYMLWGNTSVKGRKPICIN